VCVCVGEGVYNMCVCMYEYSVCACLYMRVYVCVCECVIYFTNPAYRPLCVRCANSR